MAERERARPLRPSGYHVGLDWTRACWLGSITKVGINVAGSEGTAGAVAALHVYARARAREIVEEFAAWGDE